MDEKEFAAFVVAEMRKRGWRQLDLAEKSGLTKACISRVVHADHGFMMYTVTRILKAFGMKMVPVKA